MRRTLIALTTGLLLVACGGGDDDADAPGATAAQPTATGPTAAETPAETTGVTPLDGTWSASGITTAEIGRAIKREGFGEAEVEFFLGDMGASETLDLTWKVQAMSFTLSGVADGDRTIGRIDAGDLEVEGDIVTFRYYSGGSSTLRWSVAGDRLELELLEDIQAGSTAFFVAGLYTSAPWERLET